MGIPFSENAAKIRVYSWDQRPFGTPLDYCTREQAERFIKTKLARRRMSGFAIQFRNPVKSVWGHSAIRLFIKIIIHGMSCEMGERVTEAACDEQEPCHKLAR